MADKSGYLKIGVNLPGDGRMYLADFAPPDLPRSENLVGSYVFGLSAEKSCINHANAALPLKIVGDPSYLSGLGAVTNFTNHFDTQIAGMSAFTFAALYKPESATIRSSLLSNFDNPQGSGSEVGDSIFINPTDMDFGGRAFIDSGGTATPSSAVYRVFNTGWQALAVSIDSNGSLTSVSSQDGVLKSGTNVRAVAHPGHAKNLLLGGGFYRLSFNDYRGNVRLRSAAIYNYAANETGLTEIVLALRELAAQAGLPPV